jgi:hypothetical protein
MSNQPAPPVSLDRIPESVLLRWMMKAALLGLFVGTAVGIAALRAG